MKNKRPRRLTLGIVLFIIVLGILVTAFVNAIAFTKYPFAGFFFQPNRYVSFTERSSWEGMTKGVSALDRIEYVNNVKIRNGTHALKMIQAMKPHSEVMFTFKAPDGRKDIRLSLSEFTLKDLSVTFLLPFLIGLFFIVTGFVVFLLNPLKKTALINYLSSLFIALFFSTVLDSNTTYWFYRLFALYPFFGAAAVHLILIITASKFLKKHPFTEALPYLVAGSIVAFQQYFLYSEYSVVWIYMVSPIFLVGCVVLNFVYLMIYYMTTRDVFVRRKTRFYLIALIFGTIIPTLWSISFAFGRPLFSLDLAIALSIFYPIFMGYAITREDLFNLESIVRTTLEYFIFTGIVIGAYFATVAITSLTIQRYIETTPLINTILTILIVILLSPFRKRIQTFIDKTFYPERYDTLDRLNEITTKLSYVRDKKTLGIVLGKKISSAIYLKDAGLIYPAKDGKTSYFSSPSGNIHLDISRHAIQRIFPHPGLTQYIDDIVEVSPPRAKRRELTELAQLSPQYFLPIGKDKTRGILVIGKKLKEDARFIHDDFNLLKSLYPQIEIALVNAELHEQKADQERLAAIGEVSSIIIHEIKNPLGIIKLNTSTIRKRIKEDSKSLEVLGFIEEETNRMNDTVTNFLNFAKPKYPIKRVYDIQELIAYLTNIKLDIEKDGHRLKINIAEDVRTFFIDPDHLKQILLNLLLNAKDAMPDGGTILLDIYSHDGGIEVSVSDCGRGISAQIASRVFDPFFTTKEHGTGLGLSVIKQLARSNGGDIKWKNRPEGGAIFTMSIQHEGEIL